METIHAITTTSKHNNHIIEDSKLVVGTLNLQEVSDLTEDNIIKELLIQNNNLRSINDNNLSGYLTPRDIRKSLEIVQDNIGNLVTLIIEKKNS